MLAHRLRRWTNIEPTLGECLVFAGRAIRRRVIIILMVRRPKSYISCVVFFITRLFLKRDLSAVDFKFLPDYSQKTVEARKKKDLNIMFYIKCCPSGPRSLDYICSHFLCGHYRTTRRVNILVYGDVQCLNILVICLLFRRSDKVF